MDRHIYWLELAYKYAQKSLDTRTQNGAVIVAQNHLIGWGYNDIDIRNGIKDLPERRIHPLKDDYTIHAEQAAIFDAAQNGFSTYDATMYAPWMACLPCARAIVASGINKVVCHECVFHDRKDWAESIAKGMAYLEEAWVEIVKVKHLFNMTIRFNGEEVVV